MSDWNAQSLIVVHDPNPDPRSATVCGEFPASSKTNSSPFLGPTPVGLKVTPIAQLAPGANVGPHSFDCAKSLAKDPPIEMARIDSATALLLVRFMICAAALVPVCCGAKVRTVGETNTPA
jgi:hypothetical protein